MLNQKILFTKDEVLKIRNYVTQLDDRVIGTYHPSINDGKHDPNGGHNLAQHLQWENSEEYNWIFERILTWLQEFKLPVENLGHEFIIQKYLKGFEFKPHIDDVLSSNKKDVIRARYYTILIQFSEPSEYTGGELWVNNIDYEGNSVDIKVNNQIGNVSIFDQGKLHWVTPIKSGERWSCTIFLEKNALKKSVI